MDTVKIREEQRVVEYNVILTEEELRQLFRLMRNEIEGAECCEATTSAMYYTIKKFIDRPFGSSGGR